MCESLRELLKPFVCQGCSKIEPVIPAPLPLPTIRGEITLAELYQLLREIAPQANIHISDKIKYLCDIEDINTFLAQDETNHYKYSSEEEGKEFHLDCDGFTFILMGNFSVPGWEAITKGIIWTEKHALMFCIDANRDFWWIEPQNDSVKSKLEPAFGSKINLVIM